MSRPPSPHRSPDAVERLYVYWMVSSVLLLLVAIVPLLFLRGLVQRQAAELRALGARIAALESRPEAAVRPAAPSTAPAPEPARPPDVGAAAEPTESVTPPAPAEPAASLDEAGIRALLNQALGRRPASAGLVADRRAAERAVKAGLDQGPRAGLSGATWGRLAAVARLLNRDAAAEQFARHAEAAGDPLLEYAEVSARTMLGRKRPTEALVHARRLADRAPGPRASALLAAALYASDDLAGADEVLMSVHDLRAIAPEDLLRLGRVAAELERWKRLNEILASTGRVAPALQSERDFLQALALLQADRTTEALALLDFLAGHLADSQPSAPPTDREEVAPRNGAGPDGYEIEVWRGAALARAGQGDAARQAFDRAAQIDATRPGVYYQRALLEVRAGRTDIAKLHLQGALARTARHAPAWETLGLLELNAGDAAAALESIRRAIEINPRRATARFAAALAYAKVARRDAAETELRAALALDADLLAQARQTEVLLRLFRVEELDAMAGVAASNPSAAAPTTQPEERP